MLNSSSAIAAKPALPPAAPPSAQAPLPGMGAAGGPSFAQFLNDQPDLPPAHPDPAPEEPAEAAAAPSAPANATRRPAAPAKPAAPAQVQAPATDAPRATDAAEASDDAGPATKAAAEPDAEASGLNEFTQLIGLALPAPAVQPVPAPVAAAAAAPADDGVVALTAGPRAGRVVVEEEPATAGKPDDSDAPAERRPADSAARGALARAKPVEVGSERAASTRSATGEAPAATAAPAAASPRPAAIDALAPTNFAAVMAQALPGGITAADSAAPATGGRVQAALHSPGFAPELAARVSLLAVDGVQHAELQLNPAEMGPVAVQIVVDGSQAQVSFHALQAETRQALEQSLPDLAAALQGQGLTLSGGGVFQQASQDRKGGDDSGQAAGTRADSSRTTGVDGRASVAAPPVRRSVGLLDTFA